jgi:integral membrane protein (TIGR01906 family)
MKKKLTTLYISLVILVTLLLINIVYWGTNSNYYSKIHRDLAIDSKVVTTQDQLDYINQEFTNYLKFRRDNLYINIELKDEVVTVFNEKEISHMRDVKDLFAISYGLIIAGLIVLIITIYYNTKKSRFDFIYKIVKTSLFTTTLIAIAFAIIFTTSFDTFWHYFHKVFFTNDLYLLNPKTDFLIQIMPLDFFIKISIRILSSFYIIHVLLLILSKLGVVYSAKNRS